MYLKWRSYYYNNKRLLEAWTWYVTKFEENLEYKEFMEKYPIGSKGAVNFHTVGGYFELLGCLVYEGYIPEQIHINSSGQTGYNKAKKIVEGIRKDTNNPYRYENWHYVSNQIDKYWAEHQKGKPRYE